MCIRYLVMYVEMFNVRYGFSGLKIRNMSQRDSPSCLTVQIRGWFFTKTIKLCIQFPTQAIRKTHNTRGRGRHKTMQQGILFHMRLFIWQHIPYKKDAADCSLCGGVQQLRQSLFSPVHVHQDGFHLLMFNCIISSTCNYFLVQYMTDTSKY